MTRRFTQLLVVTSAALTVSARIPSQLNTRDFTGAPCQPQFQWLNNEDNIDPCQLASTVYGSCTGPNFDFPPLTQGNGYNTPATGTTVSQCSCSWAAYNLVEACTFCQGQGSLVLSWDFYSTNCSGQTSNQFFPPTQFLFNNTKIPAYAQKDPITWPNHTFNITIAEQIHDQGLPDSGQPSSNSTTSAGPSHVGPIVGGVIGGLAVIALAGGVAFFMYRRKQKQTQPSITHVGSDGSKHGRTVSDLSQKSGLGFGYQQLDRSFATSPTSQPPLSPTTGTMHTHSASVNSLSYFGSVSHSVVPYGTAASPPPGIQVISPGMMSSSPPPNNTQALNREDIIVPFTLPPSDPVSQQSSNVNLVDRKRADGAIIPVYDPPNSFPTHLAPSDPSATPRSRVNPPAYSDVQEASVAPSQVIPGHSKKGSVDTQFSIDSKTNGPVSIVQRTDGNGGGSMSAISEVIGQMGLAGQESVSGGGTLSTGQSRQITGAQLFRPVLGNPDP